MTQAHKRTIDTYNRAADFLIEHYEHTGDRAGDIALGFALAGNPENAQVLEIGCGYGREARIILQRTPYYTGLDASHELIERARKRVPNGTFIEADAEEYDFPVEAYDLIFSFAVLRHLNQAGVQTVLAKMYRALKPGGIFYASLMYGEKYAHHIRQDAYGQRDMYSYNPQMIQKLAGPYFRKTYQHRDTFDGLPWFEVSLQK